MNHLTDSELLALVKTDPAKGFRHIYDKYWDILFNMAYKRLQDVPEAQDLVQEVFVTVWDQLHKMAPDKPLLPFLQVVLRNRIFNLYAKQAVRLRYIVQAQVETAIAQNDLSTQLTLKELQQRIDAAIAALPPRMREIFLLSREGQLTPAEIAEQLSLSVQTVKNQLHRATDKLRQDLGSNLEPAILLLLLPIFSN